MELSAQNSDRIFLQIYFSLFLVGVYKTRGQGPHPEYSRYELITWGIIKILFGVTPAKIKTLSRHLHYVCVGDTNKIEKYQKEHFSDINITEKHHDIIKSINCENEIVSDFFTKDNREKVAGAFIASMRKFDKLRLDDDLQNFMKEKFENNLHNAEFEKLILDLIEKGDIKKLIFDFDTINRDITSGYIDSKIIFMEIKNKPYIWIRGTNIVFCDKDKLVNTYAFLKKQLSTQLKNLSYSELIDGCKNSLKQRLFKKLKTLE